MTDIRRNESGMIRENLILKGNNLVALHVLKKQFRGKVDLIYIDPPYNPPSNANTFCYNNTFNNSSWLTFMRNRLEAAKLLMKKEGALVVAIDDNEHAYLGVLLDEIFPSHEVHCITIVHNPRGVQGTNFSYTHEYAYFVIPAGRKTINHRKIPPQEIDWNNLRNWGGESLREDARNCFYPIIVNPQTSQIVGFGDVCPDEYHPGSINVATGELIQVYPIDGERIERKWRYARQSVEQIKHLLRARKKNGVWDMEIGKDFGLYKTVWMDTRYDANEYGTKIVKQLVPNCAFDFPKSLHNVYDCIYAVVADKREALVLDFFAGSGTTAHAVLELNREDGGGRRFILVEQMDYIEEVTVERVRKVVQNNAAGLLNVGSGGDFVYCELMRYNEAFMDRIQAAKTGKELLTLWKDIAENSFLNWYVNPAIPEDAVKDFENIGKEENGQEKQKKLLAELLNKNQLYVNLSEIEDAQFGVSMDDKALNRAFYGDGA